MSTTKKFFLLALAGVLTLAAANVADLLATREPAAAAASPRDEALRAFGPEVVRVVERLEPGHKWDGSASELQALRAVSTGMRYSK